MGKKYKRSNSRQQPNAPELQQILQQQPPHNPYYPDPSSDSPRQVPPPPYSETATPLNIHQPQTVAMSQIRTAGDGPGYTRYHNYPNHQGASVVIQQVPYDYRADRYNRKVKSFNSQVLFIGIIAALTSIWAYSMYRDRPCLFNFTVHKPNKDLQITIGDVKRMHLDVAVASGFIILLCLMKGCFGFQGKSHSCYLFLMAVATFFATLFTGYLAYLTFYSPCTTKLNDIFSNVSKSVLGSIVDSLPSPDRGALGETNVFRTANDDHLGLVIFIIDLLNFVFYFAAFLTSTVLC